MNDRERAQRLARAIDDFLSGDHSMEAADRQPAGMEEEEIAALLRVTKGRMDEAAAAIHESVQHEGAIWQQVLHRLDRRARTAARSRADADEVARATYDIVTSLGVEEDDCRELAEIVHLRREMGERAALLAEAHRDNVWQLVQSRIEARSNPRGLFGFLARTVGTSALMAPDFLRRDPARFQADGQSAGLPWPRLVGLGAAVAILVAAIGPIPATGLAGHPAAAFARMVGSHIGVTESEAPAQVPTDLVTLQGTAASAAEASAQLGLAVAEPVPSPVGFELTSSRVFVSGVTAREGGMFVLTYASSGADSGSLAIYQERASGTDSVASIGHAFDVTLGDGTPATYVEGFWEPAAGEFVWVDGDGQALIFDRDSVRTSIQYRGPNRDPAFLFGIANSLKGR